MSMKTYKYRLYPNKAEIEKMEWTLTRCRELYNAALDERKSATRRGRPLKFCGSVAILEPEKTVVHRQISKYDQSRELTEIKNEIRLEYKEINDHILRNVLERVDLAFKAFFRRVKNGEKPGFPRFMGKARYDSFSSDSGYKLIPDKKNKKKAYLKLQNIGKIRVRYHRPMEGTPKIYTVKREGDHWYATIVCEVEIEKLPVSYEDTGIDLGLLHFATLSNGETIENPRHYRRAEKRLASLQKERDRKKRGSRRSKKLNKLIARAHRKIKNQRKDFHHKESRKLVSQYQVIVFEDLQSANLSKRPKPKQDTETGQYLPNGASAKGGLNKSINDAGWYGFTEKVKSKAAWAGRKVLFVNPRNTSQVCSACGKKGPHKDLEVRTHTCVHCGIVLDRDHNAAINILRLGQQELASGVALENAS